MKKIYILFMAGALALGAVSCSKDDDNSGNNNNPNPNPNPTVDVWAKSVGTYSGSVTTSTGGTTDNMTVTVTKINDAKIKITPGQGNTLMKEIEIPVFKGDTSLYHQQGSFFGSFYIIANTNPQVLVLDDQTNQITYYGEK